MTSKLLCTALGAAVFSAGAFLAFLACAEGIKVSDALDAAGILTAFLCTALVAAMLNNNHRKMSEIQRELSEREKLAEAAAARALAMYAPMDTEDGEGAQVVRLHR